VAISYRQLTQFSFPFYDWLLVFFCTPTATSLGIRLGTGLTENTSSVVRMRVYLPLPGTGHGADHSRKHSLSIVVWRHRVCGNVFSARCLATVCARTTKNTVPYCQECVFIGPLPSSRDRKKSMSRFFYFGLGNCGRFRWARNILFPGRIALSNFIMKSCYLSQNDVIALQYCWNIEAYVVFFFHVWETKHYANGTQPQRHLDSNDRLRLNSWMM
jgi:hypothetical protein